MPQRVRALLTPAPSPRILPFVPGALLLALCCAALANAASESEDLVDTAVRAQCAADAGAADAKAADAGAMAGAGAGHRPQRPRDACCDHGGTGERARAHARHRG
ncbi:hypothetical protein [Streptomyces sp. NPDC001083]|uniref:hypothetical protein n=1 Tax=Streptomyces sp. NPDC001083 TaxID=3364545 RepID=UPI0036C40493